MILENKSENIVMEEGVSQSTTEMSIDTESTAFIMQMLSKFYSDGVGSAIRETASNALDSHRASGVDEPILVNLLRTTNNNFEFSVEDFGVGIDDNDVENIIKKYGKSTKRASKDQLGAFGLGFKSPLAYTSSFYFIGRKDGIERKWMMYEGEEESNKIDLLYENKTTARNGVKVIIPIKWTDKIEFIQKIKEQLPYFENVYFNVEGVANSFKIVRNEHFQWSELNNDKDVHICLDNVYYPLDYGKMGINRINLPIGLRFSLSDGLFPTPNRESIKYTKEAKEIILKKIKTVADHFINKYNESIKDTDDIKVIFNYYNNSHRTVENYSGGEWNINEISKYSSVKMDIPKLNNINLLDLKRVNTISNYLLQEYRVEQKLHYGRFTTLKYEQKLNLNYISSGSTFIYSEPFGGIKKEYVKYLHKNATFIKKTSTIPLKGKNNYDYTSWKNLLELRSISKDKWRPMIKEARYIIDLILKDIINLDTLVIDKTWLDERKRIKAEAIKAGKLASKKKKLIGEITGKIACSLGRYVAGKNCKLVPENFNLAIAHQSKQFIIFGCSSDERHEEFVNKWYRAVPRNIRFVLFSERELKNLKDVKLHNWMKIKDFEKGEHKVFKRVVTAYLVHKLITSYGSVFNRSKLLSSISTDLFNKLTKLQEYSTNYYIGANEELYKTILELAEDKKLFDTETYVIYKEVKTILEKLTFLMPLLGAVNPYTEEEAIVPIIRDLCKYYKQRIDWKNYKLVLDEEIPVAVTEELIEELIN